jgi:hypothetical protein
MKSLDRLKHSSSWSELGEQSVQVSAAADFEEHFVVLGVADGFDQVQREDVFEGVLFLLLGDQDVEVAVWLQDGLLEMTTTLSLRSDLELMRVTKSEKMMVRLRSSEFLLMILARFDSTRMSR